MIKLMIRTSLTCLMLMSCSKHIEHPEQHCSIMRVDSDFGKLLPLFDQFNTEIAGELRVNDLKGIITVYEFAPKKPYPFSASYFTFIGGDTDILKTTLHTDEHVELNNKFYTFISKHMDIVAYSGSLSLCEVQTNGWDKNATTLAVADVIKTESQ